MSEQPKPLTEDELWELAETWEWHARTAQSDGCYNESAALRSALENIPRLLATIEAQRVSLVRALERWGEHDDLCGLRVAAPDGCSCGLDAVMFGEGGKVAE